jgi:cytolysin (calcineurin-like family phosphatase)
MVTHSSEAHCSDGPLFRQPIAPTAYFSDNPLFRQKWSKVHVVQLHVSKNPVKFDIVAETLLILIGMVMGS